jgi:DNA-binding transcriptional regulator YdaS (Cro superfamily)
MKNKNKLTAVIAYFGNQSAMARELGVTRASVSSWILSGIVPPARAIQIEKVTAGEFKATELC